MKIIKHITLPTPSIPPTLAISPKKILAIKSKSQNKFAIQIPEITSKTCKRCNLEQSIENFYLLQNRTQPIYSPYCKQCHKNAAKISYKQRKINELEQFFMSFEGDHLLDPIQGEFHPLIFLQIEQRQIIQAMEFFNQKYRTKDQDEITYGEIMSIAESIHNTPTTRTSRHIPLAYFTTRKWCPNCKYTWPTYFGSQSPALFETMRYTNKRTYRIDSCFKLQKQTKCGWSKYCKLCLDAPTRYHFYNPTTLPPNLITLLEESGELENEYKAFIQQSNRDPYCIRHPNLIVDFQKEYNPNRVTYSN